LGTAVAYAQSFGLDSIWARVQQLANTLRDQLRAIPGVTVRDKGVVQGGIVTFTAAGVVVGAVQQFLRQQQINVTTSTVRSTRLDMEERQLAEVVRASVHYFNTEEEIERFCGVIGDLYKQGDVVARLQQSANPRK
jgi:selenocysteine lyase/cysteine desulfurase